MKKPIKASRRGFLAGLVGGAGAVAAATAMAKSPTPSKAPEAPTSAKGPVLYRRTEEVERYYKTLYT